MQVNVEAAEHMTKLQQKKASEGVNVLVILKVAQLHILISIKHSHCLIKEVFLAVCTLRNPDQQLCNESANGQFHIDVTVVVI